MRLYGKTNPPNCSKWRSRLLFFTFTPSSTKPLKENSITEEMRVRAEDRGCLPAIKEAPETQHSVRRRWYLSCDSFHISSVLNWQKVRDIEQTGCQKFGLVDSQGISGWLLSTRLFIVFPSSSDTNLCPSVKIKPAWPFSNSCRTPLQWSMGDNLQFRQDWADK